MKILLPLVAFSLLLTSCKTTVKNIHVEGLVTDSQSRKPIQGAKVIILSWKPSGFELDDIDYVKSEVITDKDGRFIATFERGLRLDIGVMADGYIIARSSLDELHNGTVNASLSLDRIDALHPETITTTMFENLFVGLRDYFANHDLKRTIALGINLKEGKSTEKQSEFDVWAERDEKNGFPDILCTPKSGGLIPIFEKDIKRSVLFEKYVAPSGGYLTHYKLLGNEAGFFVKSRDGESYGKLILKPEKTDVEGRDEIGVFKEYRIYFRVIYQPDGSPDLFTGVENVDLEQYLLNSIK